MIFIFMYVGFFFLFYKKFLFYFNFYFYYFFLFNDVKKILNFFIMLIMSVKFIYLNNIFGFNFILIIIFFNNY